MLSSIRLIRDSTSRSRRSAARAIAIARLGDQVRVIERRAGRSGRAAPAAKIVVGKQRAASLHHDHGAPGVHAGADRGNEHAAALPRQRRRQLGLTLGRACCKRRPRGDRRRRRPRPPCRIGRPASAGSRRRADHQTSARLRRLAQRDDHRRVADAARATARRRSSGASRPRSSASRSAVRDQVLRLLVPLPAMRSRRGGANARK